MSSEKTDFFSRKKKKKEKSNVFRNWEYREIFILRFLYFGPVITSWFSIPSSDSNWWRCSPWPTCSIFENFKTLFFSFFFFLSHGSISFGPWLQCSRREVFHPEKKQRFCWTQFGEENMELWTYLSNGTNQKLRSPPHPSLFVPSGFWTI